MTLAGAVSPKAGSRNPHPAGAARLTHLQRLEAESIHILREVVAESENPVLLYSIGKDSSVLLHLAPKRPSTLRGCRSRSCMSTRPGSSGT